ncbi:MAG: hypothetical protein IJP86_08870 [Synergistaceae bacterium]|nr:hypothetical protein [Synergistaceae bacterium]
MALLLMSQSSWASVSYFDADGSEQTCDEYTSVASDTTSWTDGGWDGAGIGGGYSGSGGTTTINGGNVTANGGEYGAGMGGGKNGSGGTITLGWTNETEDSIYASSYKGTVTLTSGFLIDGADTETAAIPGNIGGKKIVPSLKVHALSADKEIAAVPWEVEGKTVTLTHSKAGYKAVYSVNGEAIEGDSFTMPEANATITATFTPIVYTLTYDLADGSLAEGVSNPATYTVESDDFTLTNPTRGRAMTLRAGQGQALTLPART